MKNILVIFVLTSLSITAVADIILDAGMTVSLDSIQRRGQTIRCLPSKPTCIISSGSGGFLLTILDQESTHSSSFLRIAQDVKSAQRAGQCEGVVLKTSDWGKSPKTLYPGESLALDYSRGINAVNCMSIAQSADLPKCYIINHPVSAASLRLGETVLDSRASMLRDDYTYLEKKYSDLLEDIGLCSL